MVSVILKTPAQNLMSKDHRRHYHNMAHVAKCEEWAKRFGFFSPGLDLAIAYHDCVYDEFPKKEFRSMCVLQGEYAKLKDDIKLVTYQDVEEASDYILSTVNHDISLTEKREMIYIDLADLTDPWTTIQNFTKIFKESLAIYGKSEYDTAKTSLDFMVNLEITCAKNKEIDKTSPYDYYWSDVITGIHITQGLYAEIIHNYDKKLRRIKNCSSKRN